MNILFTICGRAGSKGIKNKNIRNFVGKPLPYYTMAAIDLYLKKHDVSYDIVINSDSDILLEMMTNNHLRSVDTIKRVESLSGDSVGKIDVISNCLDIMEERKGTKYDIVVDLDITSPLRTVKDIENLIDTHVTKKPDVTTSVTTCRRNPYFNQVKRTDKGFKKVIQSDYTARQQAPEIFDMNASLYAYSPEYLHSGRGVLDGYLEVIEMYDTGVLDLDHENDFELLEVIAEYLFEKNQDFAEINNNIWIR